MEDQEIKVSCMAEKNNFWDWPKEKDEVYYTMDNVVSKLKPPEQLVRGRAMLFKFYDSDLWNLSLFPKKQKY